MPPRKPAIDNESTIDTLVIHDLQNTFRTHVEFPGILMAKEDIAVEYHEITFNVLHFMSFLC